MRLSRIIWKPAATEEWIQAMRTWLRARGAILGGEMHGRCNVYWRRVHCGFDKG